MERKLRKYKLIFNSEYSVSVLDVLGVWLILKLLISLYPSICAIEVVQLRSEGSA